MSTIKVLEIEEVIFYGRVEAQQTSKIMFILKNDATSKVSSKSP